MESNVEIEYANAYSEVLEVLNHMSKDNYDKIPKEMIEMFKDNFNKGYQFSYDLNKEFAEQEISKRGKLILAILFRDYWATTEQKEKIITRQKHEIQKLEQQKLEKYPIDNLFSKKTITREENYANNSEHIKKENILKRIINRIRIILAK